MEEKYGSVNPTFKASTQPNEAPRAPRSRISDDSKTDPDPESAKTDRYTDTTEVDNSDLVSNPHDRLSSPSTSCI